MLLTFGVATLWTTSLAAIFAASVSDFRHRIIPNRMVAVTAGCGVMLRLLADPGLIGFSLLAALAVMLILGLLAHQQIIGGGDAKLIAAVTLLLPLDRILSVLLQIAIGGGLLSVFYLVAHLMLRKAAAAPGIDGPATGGTLHVSTFRREVAKIAAHRSIPYGLAVFAGTGSYALTEAQRWFYATS